LQAAQERSILSLHVRDQTTLLVPEMLAHLLLGLTCLFAGQSAPAHAKSVLTERKGSLRAKVNATAFQREISEAMGEALGCGGHVGEDQLVAIENSLRPIWQALPKVAPERIERGSLRYMVHRYFSKKSAFMVRGFEPSRTFSASSWGTADILSQRVPGYVESVLESRHVQENGFDLQDAVRVVATLEQLIFDSESSLLEQVYAEKSIPTSHSLSSSELGPILDDYMVHWMMGSDVEGIKALLSNRTFLESAFPHWQVLKSFVRGQVRAVDFRRQREPRAASRPGHHALAPRYSFGDAHEVVGGISSSFASFWESECISMKAALVAMDTHGTGRVPLSRFYASALDSDWRFGESETYLRELGALDETSSWRGKQVIIPNYIQAASNCIVSTAHYLVCCINECEGLLGDIEVSLGAPAAEPARILALVLNMTSQATVDDDEAPAIAAGLEQQLQQIAAANDGLVPLHGRLFAQWLHYAFPRECPFPHKRGTAAAVTPLEFGVEYLASGNEMEKHASTENATSELDMGDLQWMSQWSSEEELLTDSVELRAPWESRHLAWASCLLACCALFGLASFGLKPLQSGALLLPTHQKAHFV